MNRLSDRLKGAKLTPQQRRIADYFFKNQERIGNMSSMDVAKEIGVSDASIIRFARAIGYLGFTDLKNDIYNSLIGETSASVRNMQLSERFDVLTGRYQEDDISGAFVEMMNYNIIRTFQRNSLESYETLADMIIRSRRKYVAGLRGCIGVSCHFTRLLGFAIEGVVQLPGSSETEVLGALQDIDSEDIFILFSFARYYKIDMLLVNMAREHKARICVVTDSLMAPMVQYADIALLVETSHMSFFNSAIGVDMIAEYIITLVCRKNKDEYRKRAKERDTMTEGFRLVL